MSYTVKPLGPDLAKTFVDYIGRLDFHHAPHWSTCYCRYFYTDCSHEQWFERTGEQNAAEALEMIEEGNMNGYLAFDGDTCIGWCCADDAKAYVRLKEEMRPIIQGKKAGAVLCYVIHPDYRGQGVARLLLRCAVEAFKQKGYDILLAQPVDLKSDLEKRFNGTLKMYQEQGFTTIQQHGDLSVMMLDLKA